MHSNMFDSKNYLPSSLMELQLLLEIEWLFPVSGYNKEHRLLEVPKSSS